MPPPRKQRPVQAADPGRTNGNGNGRRKPWRRRRDWGGIVARILCGVFAVVGLVPLAVGVVVRLDSVQEWAAERTAKLIADQLGVSAKYDVELRPWPLSLAMEDVEVAASDGGTPFLRARRVVARPRLFRLLAGEADLGEVEIEEPELRAVVANGKLVNLSYHLPESEGGEGPKELPLQSVSLSNAHLDVTVDGNRVVAAELDVDLALARQASDREPLLPIGAVELALRAGRIDLDMSLPAPGHPEELLALEDAVCRLDLRARIDDGVHVRRMEARAAVDFDPAPGTRPACVLVDDDWRRVEIGMEGAELLLGKEGAIESVHGRIHARAPAAVVHRVLDIPATTGWVELDVDDLQYDPAERLPRLRGRLRGDGLGIDGRIVAREIDGALSIENEQILVAPLDLVWAGGHAHFDSVAVEPFADGGARLDARHLRFDGLAIEDMLDDLSVHPHAHVGWKIAHVTLDRFGGTLQPLDIAGVLAADTRDFAVYDRPSDDGNKKSLVAVGHAAIGGTIHINEQAVMFTGMNVNTGRSRLTASVSLGFDEQLGLSVAEGSSVDLRDVSPLVDIPMKGIARMSLDGHGSFGDPRFAGELQVDGFDFGGFDLGQVTQAKVAFEPLELHFTDVRLQHDESRIDASKLDIAFDDRDAAVVLTGDIDSRAAGLHLRDFFEIVHMVPDHTPKPGELPTMDPSWSEMDGLARGSARVRYVLGGRRDPCGGGWLEVKARAGLEAVHLFGASYDGGELDVDYLWDDIPAGDHGVVVDVRSGVLRKGTGTVVASATIRHGGVLHADVVGTAIPIGEFAAVKKAFGLDKPQKRDALQAASNVEQRLVVPEASLSFIASVGGQLGRLEGQADIELSPLRIGPDLLPASRVSLFIEPSGPSPPVVRVTARCGNSVTGPFDPKRWAADPVQGVYRFKGQLFDGQIVFDDLEMTDQRAKLVSGSLQLDRLDLGALANLLPGVAFSAEPPRGHLSAEVVIDELPLDDPGLAEVRTFIREAELRRGNDRVRVGAVEDPVLLSGDSLQLPAMLLELRLRGGLEAKLTAWGDITMLSATPLYDLHARLDPMDLSELTVGQPWLERSAGQLAAEVHLTGTSNAPRLAGSLQLDKGALRMKDLPVGLDDIELDLQIKDDEVKIRRATARAGNTGRISVSGRLPLRGLDITGAHATLIASDVKLPLADGVKLTADAHLAVSWDVGAPSAPRQLPNVTGQVTLTQFSYTRPMAFDLDLDQLTGRGRTEVDTYKPEDDMFAFDVRLVSPQPVRVTNNLLDLRLDVLQPGLRLSGTDQRFGARGTLQIQPGSKLFLLGHHFSVTDGTVTFDNQNRIQPRLDVHASTEYRRYALASDADAGAADAGAAGGTGGRWVVTMHAWGDTDNPRVAFTSDPPLSQDDIVLLLQVGMTRAELDRQLAGSLAQTVGLEALSAVTGLNQAVKRNVPIIDEFRVGSQYSSRTGRPEPTITLGKRITEDVRATVTSGLSENREVRSNIEWKLKGGVSVHGSYDNVNDVSSSVLGNVGVGLRWRLDFE
jgi:translocation and assembly module TamB